MKGCVLKNSVMTLTISFLLCGCTAMTESRKEAVWVVDIKKGLDSNPGTEALPFQTIDRAQTAVRNQIAGGMNQDVTVLIRAGQYYLQSPLVFDSRDSGRNGFRVIYRGDQERPAELIGGTPITGWQPHKDGIYKAPLPNGTVFYNLMENNTLGVMARTPNSGYFAAGPGSVHTGATGFPEIVLPDEVPVPFNIKNAQTLVWSGQHKEWDNGKNFDWFASLVPVAKADWDKRALTLMEYPHMSLTPRNRFYLRNALAFLDEPGEFFVDREADLVYYKPRTLPIERQTLVAANAIHSIQVRGESMSRLAENITFENLTITLSDALDRYFSNPMESHYRNSCLGMIQMTNAKNITIDRCLIRNAGLSAIAMYHFNQGHQIINSRIEDTGFGGIVLKGPNMYDPRFPDEKAAYINQDHKIINNHIRRISQLIGHGGGVDIYQAGDIEIAHNLFEELPRYGVCAYAGVFEAMVGPQTPHKGVMYGKKVTRENRTDFNFCRNLNIHHNIFRDAMKDSSDGGPVNLYGVGLGNRIANNLIYDIRPSLKDALIVGIYLDDATDGCVVENNIITRLGGTRYVVPMMVKGVGNVVNNNIIANNHSTNWGIFHILETPVEDFIDFLHEGAGPEQSHSLSFRRNIVYNNAGTELYGIFPWSDKVFKYCDENLYFHPSGIYTMSINWAVESKEAFEERSQHRYNQNSVFADPLFVDADQMNFSLKPDSPALKLGFEPIDVTSVGLTQDNPFNRK